MIHKYKENNLSFSVNNHEVAFKVEVSCEDGTPPFVTSFQSVVEIIQIPNIQRGGILTLSVIPNTQTILRIEWQNEDRE